MVFRYTTELRPWLAFRLAHFKYPITSAASITTTRERALNLCTLYSTWVCLSVCWCVCV